MTEVKSSQLLQFPTIDDAVVLITHADCDRGYHLARELLANGKRVVVTARYPSSLTRILHGHSGSRVMAVAADIDDESQSAALFERAEARLGRIALVVDGRDATRPHARPA